MHHAFLIPGFFGFNTLGDVRYFRQVGATLERNFRARGEELVVSGVSTFPAGSLRRRAARLLEVIEESGALDRADHIHLIGHSTGGLDARLCASTMRGLGRDEARAVLHRKLRTVVGIATPHYGTPIANFFSTLYGKKLLYFITLIVVMGLEGLPVSALGGIGGLLGVGFRAYDLLGLNETILRQLTNQLLRGFSPERDREVRMFLDSVLTDVSLMVQLTPEAMDVLNGAIEPVPGVRHVSYATVSPPPLLALKRSRWKDLLIPIESILYSTLYTLASSPEPNLSYHPPVAEREAVTGAPLGFPIDASSCDGVVPSLSMIHGEFRGFVLADHLDVVGHYLRGDSERGDGADWFLSGAHFDRARFDLLWNDVTTVLLGPRARQ